MLHAFIFKIGHCEPSPFDHLREACLVEGHDAAIRYGPSTEAKLIAVGEQPMVSLYRVSKVCYVSLRLK